MPGPIGGLRIVRDHDDGLLVVALSCCKRSRISCALRASRSRSARRPRESSDRWRWRGRWPRAVPARGELPRIVAHAVRQTDDVQCGFDVLLALAFLEMRQEQRQLDVSNAFSTGMRLYIWKMNPTCAARQVASFVSRMPRSPCRPRSPAARGPVDAGDQIQQRRLAGARRSINARKSPAARSPTRRSAPAHRTSRVCRPCERREFQQVSSWWGIVARFENSPLGGDCHEF